MWQVAIQGCVCGGSRAPYGRGGISYVKRGGWAFQADVPARAEAPREETASF